MILLSLSLIDHTYIDKTGWTLYLTNFIKLMKIFSGGDENDQVGMDGTSMVIITDTLNSFIHSLQSLIVIYLGI